MILRLDHIGKTVTLSPDRNGDVFQTDQIDVFQTDKIDKTVTLFDF